MRNLESSDSSCFCRDDRCERVELHFKHRIRRKTDEDVPLSTSAKAPWERSAPLALDDSITKAVSLTYPRHINAILQIVEDDYGSCNLRTVQRRLQVLVQHGHLLRIDLGRRLCAYLKPGSTLVNDIELMREQCFDAFASSVPS